MKKKKTAAKIQIESINGLDWLVAYGFMSDDHTLNNRIVSLTDTFDEVKATADDHRKSRRLREFDIYGSLS